MVAALIVFVVSAVLTGLLLYDGPTRRAWLIRFSPLGTFGYMVVTCLTLAILLTLVGSTGVWIFHHHQEYRVNNYQLWLASFCLSQIPIFWAVPAHRLIKRGRAFGWRYIPHLATALWLFSFITFIAVSIKIVTA